jgi:hypothetical protein
MMRRLTTTGSRLIVGGGLLVVSCGILIVFLIFAKDLEEARTLWKTNHKIPRIHDEWWQVYEDVFSIARDNILLEYTVGPNLSGAEPDCVVSKSWKIYGTNRSFEEVVDEYTMTLANIGWEERISPPGNNSLVYYFHIKRARIAIWDRSNCCQSEYHTIYEVQLIYMDPSYWSCTSY